MDMLRLGVNIMCTDSKGIHRDGCELALVRYVDQMGVVIDVMPETWLMQQFLNYGGLLFVKNNHQLSGIIVHVLSEHVRFSHNRYFIDRRLTWINVIL